MATRITATPPATAPGGGDKALPDASRLAQLVLAGLTVVAAGIAIALNAAGWTSAEFKPAAGATANFSLFAGFYVAAQVIERLLELVSPLLPGWPPKGTDPTVRVAETKADRASVALGVAAVLGVAASCAFGLFFLKAIGMHVSHTVDSFITGITVAAGTKPLHDFINLIQNQTTPRRRSSSRLHVTGSSLRETSGWGQSSSNGPRALR
jgi:hypothetical protein